MRFGIVGAGAMGSLFGGYLADAGFDVTLVDIDEAHVGAIRKNGLILDKGDGPKAVAVEATTDPASVAPVDLLVVFCKYLSTEAAVSAAQAYVTGETYVWTLQNGIGNVEILQRHFDDSRIVKGLTSATGIIEGPGMVSTNFVGETETYLWPIDGGKHPGLDEAARILTEAGLPTARASDIDYRIWRKLVINVTLTVLAGIMNTRIGAVYETEPGRALCEEIVRETVAVAQAAGVPLQLDDAFGYLDALSKAAVNHIGSTTVSLQKKQRTEIDAMNGAVVREGERLGVETPVNRTIARVVRLVEETAAARLSPSI